MRHRWVVSLLAALMAVSAAGSASAAGPPRDDKPVRAICASTGGGFFGPNAAFGVDTSGFTDAGYFCLYDGPAQGGTFTFATAAVDPHTTRFEKLCDASGGTFYLFERRIGPSETDVLYGGWGCHWL